VGVPVADVLTAPDPDRIVLLQDALDVTPDDAHATRARLASRLAQALYYVGPDERRAAATAAALEAAHAAADPEVLAEALVARRDLLYGPEGLTERLAIAQELVRIASATGSDDLEVLARTARAYDLAESGDVSAALADLSTLESYVVSRRLSHHRWRVVLHRGARLAWQGPIDDLEVLADEASRLAEPALGASAPWVAMSLRANVRRLREDWATPQGGTGAETRALTQMEYALQAMFLARAGQADEARRALLAAGDPGAAPSSHWWLPMLSGLGDAAALVRETSTAERVYDLLAPYAGRVVVHGRFVSSFGGAVDQVLGLLSSALGRRADAEAHFDAAEETYRSSNGNAMLVLLDRDRAIAARSTDRHRAAELRRSADDLLARLGTGAAPDRSAPTFSPLTPLTAREAEVLAHVARGLANKQIARVLGMSEKTVRNHLTSVFAKLGVADRTQAALMVAGHDVRRQQ
jgi:DNA-binding CsgD family transcriptional regulator